MEAVNRYGVWMDGFLVHKKGEKKINGWYEYHVVDMNATRHHVIHCERVRCDLPFVDLTIQFDLVPPTEDAYRILAEELIDSVRDIEEAEAVCTNEGWALRIRIDDLTPPEQARLTVRLWQKVRKILGCLTKTERQLVYGDFPELLEDLYEVFDAPTLAELRSARHDIRCERLLIDLEVDEGHLRELEMA